MRIWNFFTFYGYFGPNACMESHGESLIMKRFGIAAFKSIYCIPNFFKPCPVNTCSLPFTPFPFPPKNLTLRSPSRKF